MANAIQDPMDRLSSIIEGEKSPFVELSEKMTGTSKDIKNLNLSILNLAIALEKRAGISKSEKEDPGKPGRPIGIDLKEDYKDFKAGFTEQLSSYVKSAKDTISYLSGKVVMPPEIGKPTQDSADINTEIISPTDLTRTNAQDNIALNENIEQNKVLSDMVAVLIDMRDDKSQKQLLEEASAIKKLIIEKNKANQLPNGIEPNIEESKQEDREKLSELIAIKLGAILQESGFGSNSGMPMGFDLPERPGKNKPGGPGGKLPKTPRVPGGSMPGMGPMMGKAALMGRAALMGTAAIVSSPIAAAATVGLGAYEANEYLDDIDYGDRMKEGQGQDAEKAFKNINADFSNLDVTQQQAQDILNQPDSPGKKRDLEAFGGEAALRKKAGIPSFDSPTEEDIDVEPPKKFEQSSLRKYDYIPEINPKINSTVAPKKEETTGVDILNKVTDQNTELKMFNTGQPETQMIAPIISKQTINNTEQTTMAATPVPHSNDNTFVKWQLNRSAYT
jgi:hypothetical protein